MGTKAYDNALDLITFTRASSATYLDSDGLLKTATTNIPRIEYAADGTLKGLLVEEARTNLFTYSEDFTNAAWGKGSDLVPLTAPDAIGPDGLTSAFTLADDAGGGTSPNVWVRRVAFTLTAAAHCLSVYAKASGLSVLQVVTQAFGGTPSANGNTYFDLQAGTVGDVGNDHSSASIEAVGNGWYRCSIIFTPNATDVVGNLYLAPAEAATGGVTNGGAIDPVDADGTSSILIYGAQLEAGAFPTSYIPTSGATATRAADIASIPVSAFGYNQKAGSVVVEVRAEDTAATGGDFFFRLGAGSSYIMMDRFTTNFAFRVFDGTSQVNAVFPGAEPDTTTTYTVAAGYKLNDFAFIRSGSTLGTDTAGTVPDGITTLNLFDGNFNGHIKSIAYYPRKLSNAQLVEVTS